MKRILILILLINLLFSTTLFGEIFDAEEFSKLNNTILKIEGDTTIQVTVDGNYSLELPEGNYTLTASYYENGKLKYYTKEELNLNQEVMQFDLVLLPGELVNILPDEQLTNGNLTNDTEKTDRDQEKSDYTPFIIAFVLGTIIFVIGYFVIPKKEEEQKIEDEDKSDQELDDDCKKVLKILEENEGRMNQKEIRDILNFSETKMSLVVAELETVKKIKKIKKGRQNILKLVK